jgi:peptide/nickel transport system permease protein
MPNALPPLIVQATLSIASAVIAEASFSFLGLGQQPPLPSWGSMRKPPKTTWTTRRLWQCGPVLRFFLLVLSFNLLGMACAMRGTPDKNE